MIKTICSLANVHALHNARRADGLDHATLATFASAAWIVARSTRVGVVSANLIRVARTTQFRVVS